MNAVTWAKRSASEVTAKSSVKELVEGIATLKRQRSGVLLGRCPLCRHTKECFMVADHLTPPQFLCRHCKASGSAVDLANKMRADAAKQKSGGEGTARQTDSEILRKSALNAEDIDLLDGAIAVFRTELFHSIEAVQALKSLSILDTKVSRYEIGYQPDEARMLKTGRRMAKRNWERLGALFGERVLEQILGKLILPLHYVYARKAIPVGILTMTLDGQAWERFVLPGAEPVFGLKEAREAGVSKRPVQWVSSPIQVMQANHESASISLCAMVDQPSELQSRVIERLLR